MDFILKQHNIFRNQQNLPLNELNIAIKNLKSDKFAHGEQSKCVSEKFPALHKTFIDERHFSLYYAYYDYTEDTEIFTTNGSKFIDNLDFLLGCTYHQFWCYLTQNSSTIQMLKSFIYKFTPIFELDGMDTKCLDVYSHIHQKVGIVLCRMMKFKHSENEFMTAKTVLRLLEETTLLTFPVLMNICVLYSETCPGLVTKLTNIYFDDSRRSKWEQHVNKLLDQALLAFEMVGGLICGFDDDAIIVPIGVPPKPSHFDPTWYEDIVTFFLDTLTSLEAVMSRCEYMRIKAFNMGIPFRLTYFYNNVFPKIYKVMEYKRDIPEDWSLLKNRILDRIAKGRKECVDCFNSFMAYFIDQIMKYQGNSMEQEKQFENYLKLLTTAMDDELFIFDYHNTHAIDLQCQVIMDYYSDLDTMRTNYILECLSTLPEVGSILQKKEANERRNNGPLFQPPPPQETIPNNEGESISEDEINERIQIVADALPDLGDYFIYKCLALYDNNPIEVINAVLEENLPPSLTEIPRDAIRVPPEPEPEQPILAYRGKKPQASDAKEVLDDHSDLRQVKDYVLQATNYYDMYDDEYDDREAFGAVPYAEGKRLTEEPDPYEYMENRFDGYCVVSDPSDSSDEESESRATGSLKPTGFRAFCEDPAKLREQRELARKNFRGGLNKDVVGKPKGKGQEKQVLNNRENKNTNKAARGNHSRKRGAAFKRSRGMYS